MQRALPALALGLALAVGGCSSSSDGGPTTTADSSTTSDTATAPTDTATGGDGTATDTASGGDVLPGDSSAGDTWDSFAMGFFAKYCVECHAGGKRDYRTPTQVVRDAAIIRCGVASTTQSGCTATDPKAKQFPIDNSTKTNPKPTDAERDRIVAWLAAGAP